MKRIGPALFLLLFIAETAWSQQMVVSQGNANYSGSVPYSGSTPYATTITINGLPSGCVASIAGAAITSTALGTGGTLTILKIMAMSKLKVALIGAVVVAGVATPLVIQNQS